MIDIAVYEKAAERLKALAHPYRLCIVKGLLDGSCNASGIQECIRLPQSTVSQHLAKLRTAGIVSAERRGLEVYYSVCDRDTAELVRQLFRVRNEG